MSEGELKKRMLYDGRTFIDLYYEREARLKELMEHNVECHPDPLMDSFVSTEKVHSWLDEARKEFPCYGCDLRCVYCGHECYEFKEWFLKWLGEQK